MHSTYHKICLWHWRLYPVKAIRNNLFSTMLSYILTVVLTQLGLSGQEIPLLASPGTAALLVSTKCHLCKTMPLSLEMQKEAAQILAEKTSLPSDSSWNKICSYAESFLRAHNQVGFEILVQHYPLGTAYSLSHNFVSECLISLYFSVSLDWIRSKWAPVLFFCNHIGITSALTRAQALYFERCESSFDLLALVSASLQSLFVSL